MDEPVFIRDASFIVATRDDYEVEIHTDKSILVEDGIMTCIGDSIDCSPPRGSYVIDGRGRIVAPAPVNAHTHVAMYYLRGSLPDSEFWDWIERIMYLERETISPKLVYYSSLLGCMEMLLNGVVGFIDMYYYPVETARACTSLGLTAMLGPASSDLGVIGDELSILESMEGVIPILNIHSLYLYDEEVLSRLFEYARLHGLRKHIHVSETRGEIYKIWRKTGHWPVEYMYLKDWLDDGTILVHLNWVMSHEVEYIAEKGAMAVFCPQSSMKLAEAGFAPVYELLSKGVLASVGTDGSSGDRFNVLEEVKQLILLYRHNYWDTRLRVEWVYPRIIINGFRIMGLDGGLVEEGRPAYLAVYGIDRVRNNPLTPSNIVPVMIFSDHPRVDYVITPNGLIYSPERYEPLMKQVDEALDWLMNNAVARIDYREGKLLGQPENI